MSHRTSLCLAFMLTAAGLAACDEGKSAETTEDAPTKKRKKKKKKRATASASASATASAAPAPLPPLPPVGPEVSTDTPPDLNAPVNVELTSSGLASRVLKRGHGTVKPTVNDTVEVHYSGWTLDGNMFDSSVTRKRPSTFGVSKVIPGWTEGLQLMVEGERRRLWIPADLAYGDVPKRAGAPAGRLVFDVEILKIVQAPVVPPDLTTPPTDAIRTSSGLVYKVLQRGTSTAHPTDASKVEVHYSGWTQDGKMFDSSVTRGRPAKFGVTSVIKGWTELLKLMSPGDRVRTWIPGDLAYGETPTRPGAPAGTLVFDIELIGIE